MSATAGNNDTPSTNINQNRRNSAQDARATRATSALTAEEVFEFAEYPELVPKPLRKFRNRSAPTILPTEQTFSMVFKGPHGALSIPVEEGFDYAVDLLVSGSDPSCLALNMGISVPSLRKQVTLVALATEGILKLNDELRSFTESFAELNRPSDTGYQLYVDEYLDDILLDWEQACDDTYTLSLPELFPGHGFQDVSSEEETFREEALRELAPGEAEDEGEETLVAADEEFSKEDDLDETEGNTPKPLRDHSD